MEAPGPSSSKPAPPLKPVDASPSPALPPALVWGFAILLVLLMWPLVSRAQISPGPLSKPHQELNGSAACIKCHTVSTGSPNFRCLECHQDIAARLQQKRGYHPSLVGSAPGSTSCARCHSEHNGESFALVKWNPKQFDHAKAGWALDGKHAGLACERCHAAKNIPLQERASLTAKNFDRTYFGLSKSCATCHEDKHKGRLGQNCQQCHDSNDWKAAITKTFDHSKTRYPLTGAHAQVKCQRCHTPQADGTAKYVGLRFDTCGSCHRDVHRGEFKQSCQSCHSTVGWKQTAFIREFDHSKTKFALAGKHLEVSCASCHRGGDFKTPVAHELCGDCHKPDPHNGQFAKRADGGKCESCHTVDGWKPSKFLAADHANSAFPLRGKHVSVDCAKCHLPAGKATLFKVKFARCDDCHKDAHQRQFAAAPYFNRCEECHTEKSFHAPTFTLARHQKSAFVLTGGHLAVACNDCHKPRQDQSVAYHFANLTCETCHSDPHRGQFRVRMLVAGRDGRALGCEACHSTKQWSDLSKFDHASTKFTLVGAHRAVECIGCHRPPNMERKLLNVDFQAAPLACEQCHNDPHGSQFSHTDHVTRCAACHDAGRWCPSLFDHEKTIFSLMGAHQNTSCKGCHTQVREIAGKQVLFYKPTPTQCAACHTGPVPGKS